ncbi:MAG: hypothetical protein R6V67_05555 [Spirochaetia bacterium]
MERKNTTSYLIIFTLITCLILFASSCSSITSSTENNKERGKGREIENTAAKEAEEDKEAEEAEEKIPARRVNGEIAINDEELRDVVYTLPRRGKPVFMAVAPRRAEREEEYEYALWEIARQAALFTRLEVNAQFLTAQTTAEFGHDEKITVDVDTSLIESLRDRVVPLEHFKDNRQSLVTGLAEGFEVPNFTVDKSMKDGMPSWIFNPPRIEGHYTTVGAAERRYLLSDSIREADKRAMANLARQRRLKIDNYSDQIRTNAGSGYREFNLEVSEAKLEGFYVLARWYAPEENIFYTLAVCARAE